MKVKSVTIGNATLYLGNCFDVLAKLKIKADAVITDMPYGVTDCEWDNSIPLDKFWEMIECCTKPAANIIYFGCGKFTYELYNSKRKWYRYSMVWVKSKKCGHLNSRLMPMRNHEDILIFGRPGNKRTAVYNSQKSSGGKVGVKITNHKSSVYRDTGEYTHISDGTLHPGSALYFKNETGQHPTQKPVALMEHLVKSYSNEKEIVVDPFMGSGSTGIAAIHTGRKFIGIEQNKKYFQIACERIERAYKGVNNG